MLRPFTIRHVLAFRGAGFDGQAIFKAAVAAISRQGFDTGVTWCYVATANGNKRGYQIAATMAAESVSILPLATGDTAEQYLQQLQMIETSGRSTLLECTRYQRIALDYTGQFEYHNFAAKDEAMIEAARHAVGVVRPFGALLHKVDPEIMPASQLL